MAAIVFIKLFPLILILLGLLPSVVWLLAYLRQDPHPEPKKLIVRIFAWGMLVAPLAVLAQYLIVSVLNAGPGVSAAQGIAGLVALAAVEEFLKYLVVKTEIEDEPDFNEPADAVMYMIIAALGFAAVENISIAFTLAPTGITPGEGTNTANFIAATRVIGVRFLGATLLHTCSSAIVGYALAQRFFKGGGVWIIPGGIAVATALHAFFNYRILQSSEVSGLTVLVASIGMIILIRYIFKRTRALS